MAEALDLKEKYPKPLNIIEGPLMKVFFNFFISLLRLRIQHCSEFDVFIFAPQIVLIILQLMPQSLLFCARAFHEPKIASFCHDIEVFFYQVPCLNSFPCSFLII